MTKAILANGEAMPISRRAILANALTGAAAISVAATVPALAVEAETPLGALLARYPTVKEEWDESFTAYEEALDRAHALRAPLAPVLIAADGKALHLLDMSLFTEDQILARMTELHDDLRLKYCAGVRHRIAPDASAEMERILQASEAKCRARLVELQAEMKQQREACGESVAQARYDAAAKALDALTLDILACRPITRSDETLKAAWLKSEWVDRDRQLDGEQLGALVRSIAGEGVPS